MVLRLVQRTESPISGLHAKFPNLEEGASMQTAFLATAICAVAASVTIAADCVPLSLKDHLKYLKREATFVFDGTVTALSLSGTVTNAQQR